MFHPFLHYAQEAIRKKLILATYIANTLLKASFSAIPYTMPTAYAKKIDSYAFLAGLKSAFLLLLLSKTFFIESEMEPLAFLGKVLADKFAHNIAHGQR